MFYRKEFLFLCDVFQRSRIDTCAIELVEFKKLLAEASPTQSLDHNVLFQELSSDLRPQTMYRLTDPLECRYRFFLLPNTEEATVFYIGPYLTSPISSERLLELGEHHALTPQQQQQLAEHFASIPVVPEDSSLWIMLNTFCEMIWKTAVFSIEDISKSAPFSEPSFMKPSPDIPSEDALVTIKNMERRYAFENELIRAVEMGQVHKENQLLNAFSDQMFEKRVADPLRNVKNYSIIMNTLLRKAAERGGVHPIHLNRISSDFAKKIEQMPSVSKSSELMNQMFRDYCRLVRKHSLQKYSPVVQRAILLIESDLSAELAPHTIAKAQGISLGYLSTVFKKETGKTVSEYLRGRRMEYAAYLLKETTLQIQTIALRCGIMDVQYFSKLFKKQMHHTPTQYRKLLGK